MTHPGYKQSPDHVAKRKRSGSAHYAWKGDDASRKTGWKRARGLFALGPCERCGRPAMDRHHSDGNALNNAPDNVKSLCRRCHMLEDGRLEGLAKPNPMPKGENAHRAKLTNAQARSIRASYLRGIKQPQLAKEFGVSQAAISNLLNQKTYRDV